MAPERPRSSPAEPEPPPRGDPLPDWVERETEDWDQIARLTPRVGRFMALFVPSWLVLLLLLGLTGGPLGPLFALGTLGAALIAWRLERRWTGRREGSARERLARRRASPIRPLAAAAIGGGLILLVIYVIFVLASAGS